MIRRFNISLILVPAIVFLFGFVTLLSTSPSLIRSHTLMFMLGEIAFVVFASIDYSIYKYIWKYIYFLGALLLFITDLFAEFRFGAARWLELGSLSIQTSELAKIALIFALSAYLVEQRKRLNEPRNLFVLGGMVCLYIILVFTQPDLGTSVVLFLTAVGLVFYAGLNRAYILTGLFIVGIFSAPLWRILKDYQKDRILVFLNPQLDVLGSGYNVMQSLIAIGSGGFWGKGFGQGTQANLQFLPAYWTDFIFASFAEEWGFAGVGIFITIFTLLLFMLLSLAHSCQDEFGKLVCLGIFLVFFTQFTINVGMNLGVLPVTGVTLPLVSYGGSSMIVSMAMLGVAYNVWSKQVRGKFI